MMSNAEQAYAIYNSTYCPEQNNFSSRHFTPGKEIPISYLVKTIPCHVMSYHAPPIVLLSRSKWHIGWSRLVPWPWRAVCSVALPWPIQPSGGYPPLPAPGWWWASGVRGGHWCGSGSSSWVPWTLEMSW